MPPSDPVPYGPERLKELDLELARRDPKHRAKKLEEKINSVMRAWWFRWSRRWLIEGKRKPVAAKVRIDFRDAMRELRKLTWEARR